MLENKEVSYEAFVRRFQEVIRSRMPLDATVIVVSKGDDALLNLAGRRAWHFPQRGDGVYAGYYPPNSAAAIEHLEILRAKGGDFFVLPEPALWWLGHYAEFRLHLESRYQLVLQDEAACVTFALTETAAASVQGTGSGASDFLRGRIPALVNGLDKDRMNGFFVQSAAEPEVDPLSLAKTVLDIEYYASQAGVPFHSADEAVEHYVETGAERGYNPHRLFDAAYYLNSYPAVRRIGANPLLHFLVHSISEGQNPSPYFDTEYYYGQDKNLRDHRVNALVHYLAHATSDGAKDPNPLFSNCYYLNTYLDVREGNHNPLAHYVAGGWKQLRSTSYNQHSLLSAILRPSKRALRRGGWTGGSVLVCCSGERDSKMLLTLEIARTLTNTYHLDCVVVSSRRRDFFREWEDDIRIVALEDYQLACDIFRPSAIRLAAKTLAAIKPLFALCATPEMLASLKANGVPAYFLCPEAAVEYPTEVLSDILRQARRVLFDSSAAFHAVAGKVGHYPTNAALRPYSHLAPAGDAGGTTAQQMQAPVEAYVGSVLALARRDFGLPATVYPPRVPKKQATRKIIIPCCDWTVSGVNSAIEAIGRELIRLGWDVQIVFTRDREGIQDSVGHEDHLPTIPYRFLQPRTTGEAGFWEALINDLQGQAPCIMFMAYDFAANGIAPALTEDVGVVAWLQADDGDYYEQAYRLGPYCNALVCVAGHIKNKLADLNPLIVRKAHVIHNASVRECEIAAEKPAPSETLRLVYTGRLVQYQKRVLDFVDLAHGLDRTGVPYRITLIGEFKGHEDISGLLRSRSKYHLEDGRMVLAGKMGRRQLLEELSHHDLFVLLSDFEGLPLSLLEAMARGCVPVVAEMDCGVREVVTTGENGLIISGRDYKDWAVQTVHLWRDREKLAEMSRKAREAVRQGFTTEYIGKQLGELFRRIANTIRAGNFRRPPCLRWGNKWAHCGDVLPPPPMYRPAQPQPRINRE